MISFISNRIFIYLQDCGILDNNSKAENNWLKYGIEITVSSLLSLLIILTISVVANRLIVGVVFLSVFVPIRQFVGGYHADTYLKCNLTFTICYLLILLLHQYDGIPLIWHLLILFSELAIVAVLAPVKNRHKPIRSKGHYYRCKVISVALFISFSIVGILLTYRGISTGRTILHTLDLVVVLGIIGFFKERRNVYEGTEENC